MGNHKCYDCGKIIESDKELRFFENDQASGLKEGYLCESCADRWIDEGKFKPNETTRKAMEELEAGKGISAKNGAEMMAKLLEIGDNKTVFEKAGITYKQEGDYLIPVLEIPEIKPIGRWGRAREKYLKEFQKAEYCRLDLTLSLNDHLAEVNTKAREMLEFLIAGILKNDPAPDKSRDMMAWVGHMNAVKNQAEEVVFHELIYPEEYQSKE